MMNSSLIGNCLSDAVKGNREGENADSVRFQSPDHKIEQTTGFEFMSQPFFYFNNNLLCSTLECGGLPEDRHGINNENTSYNNIS